MDALNTSSPFRLRMYKEKICKLMEESAAAMPVQQALLAAKCTLMSHHIFAKALASSTYPPSLTIARVFIVELK